MMTLHEVTSMYHPLFPDAALISGHDGRDDAFRALPFLLRFYSKVPLALPRSWKGCWPACRMPRAWLGHAFFTWSSRCQAIACFSVDLPGHIAWWWRAQRPRTQRCVVILLAQCRPTRQQQARRPSRGPPSVLRRHPHICKPRARLPARLLRQRRARRNPTVCALLSNIAKIPRRFSFGVKV